MKPSEPERRIHSKRMVTKDGQDVVAYQSMDRERGERRLDIAVVGSGISGLSAAWLLGMGHNVTVFEAADRLGGHSNTVIFQGPTGPVAVDTGFIVYNEPTYPNLTALFRALDVPTAKSNMSFAVSLDGGALEYSGGTGIRGLLAQRSNIASPRFWRMLADLVRFYRQAPRDLPTMGDITLEDYLLGDGYGRALRDDHLYPMASAIWSTPAKRIGDFSAASFVKFCSNHGLLSLSGRPVWRTVAGGSRRYVEKLTSSLAGRIRVSTPIRSVRRSADCVELTEANGAVHRFDHVVIATHADQALAMLADARSDERRLLGVFRYCRNEAVLHRDADLMPQRRAAWSSWNYVGDRAEGALPPSVTYWMNRLQPLGTAPDIFVTLNPRQRPKEELVIRREFYEHPIFDGATDRAQKELWSLQGKQNTWFCGAHFGHGFHEDGLQAGLAVAEDLGGLKRPWQVADESGRIVRMALRANAREGVAA